MGKDLIMGIPDGYRIESGLTGGFSVYGPDTGWCAWGETVEEAKRAAAAYVENMPPAPTVLVSRDGEWVEDVC